MIAPSAPTHHRISRSSSALACPRRESCNKQHHSGGFSDDSRRCRLAGHLRIRSWHYPTCLRTNGEHRILLDDQTLQRIGNADWFCARFLARVSPPTEQVASRLCPLPTLFAVLSNQACASDLSPRTFVSLAGIPLSYFLARTRSKAW